MDDREQIVATVCDYWEGWFDGDVARMERALHPDLGKVGIAADGGSQSMTATDMIGWTRAGEGVAAKPADPAYDVIVNDIYPGIATVTVHSTIFREYLHLMSTPDGWKIRHAFYTRVVD